jgi:hypothetical protein
MDIFIKEGFERARSNLIVLPKRGVPLTIEPLYFTAVSIGENPLETYVSARDEGMLSSTHLRSSSYKQSDINEVIVNDS